MLHLLVESTESLSMIKVLIFPIILPLAKKVNIGLIQF